MALCLLSQFGARFVSNLLWVEQGIQESTSLTTYEYDNMKHGQHGVWHRDGEIDIRP